MYMNMREYPTLHLDTVSKGTACSKKMDVYEHERVSNITLRHKVK